MMDDFLIELNYKLQDFMMNVNVGIMLNCGRHLQIVSTVCQWLQL